MRISDWSSDVCSSDLHRWRTRHERQGARQETRPQTRPGSAARAQGRGRRPGAGSQPRRQPARAAGRREDRKSVAEGKSVSVRVDLGGRRIIKKKTKKKDQIQTPKTLISNEYS